MKSKITRRIEVGLQNPRSKLARSLMAEIPSREWGASADYMRGMLLAGVRVVCGGNTLLQPQAFLDALLERLSCEDADVWPRPRILIMRKAMNFARPSPSHDAPSASGPQPETPLQSVPPLPAEPQPLVESEPVKEEEPDDDEPEDFSHLRTLSGGT